MRDLRGEAAGKLPFVYHCAETLPTPGSLDLPGDCRFWLPIGDISGGKHGDVSAGPGWEELKVGQTFSLLDSVGCTNLR